MNQQKADKFISRCPWSGSDLQVLSKTKKGLIGGLIINFLGFAMVNFSVFQDVDGSTGLYMKCILLQLAMVIIFIYCLCQVAVVEKFIVENGFPDLF